MPETDTSALYIRFGPVIFSRCQRVLRDRAAAEDATQEVFLRVLKQLQASPDEASAVRYIYRASTNYCLNRIRDLGREELVAAVPEPASAHLEDLLTDRNLVMKLMGRVPAKLRGPAMLHLVDGMDQEQVARTLGITRRTVINRLARFSERARKFLRRETQS